MGQTQGGVRVRTLRLGKAILLLAGARGATGFVEICFLLEVKHPPAEPGALKREPLKAAERGR